MTQDLPTQTAPAQRTSPWLLAEVAMVGLAAVVLLDGLAQAFEELRGFPVLDDVQDMLRSAHAMQGLMDSGTWEPVVILWHRLGIALGDTTARLVTVAHTLFALLALHQFARRQLGPLAAMTAVWLFAVNLTVHFYGVSGLRDMLYCATLLFFLRWLLTPLRPASEVRSGVILGLVGALLFLTRVYALLVVSAGLVVWVVTERAWLPAVRRQALLRVGLALALFIPVVVVDRSIRGPTQAGNNATFMRNVEECGTSEVEKCPLRPVGIVEYIFWNRNIVDVTVRVISNHVLFVYEYLPSFFHGYPRAGVLLFVIGLGLAIWRKRYALLAMLVVALSPVVFLLNVNQTLGARGVDKRLVLHVWMMCLAIACWALWELVVLALVWAAKREPKLLKVSQMVSRAHVAADGYGTTR